MIDVAIAIDGESTNVDLTARASGTYVEGEFVPGVATTTTIRAAIFPLSGNARSNMFGNELKDMPEGIRTEAGWLCWSRSAIAIDNEIASGGIVYRVLLAWPRLEGGFYRAVLGRKLP